MKEAHVRLGTGTRYVDGNERKREGNAPSFGVHASYAKSSEDARKEGYFGPPAALLPFLLRRYSCMKTGSLILGSILEEKSC